MSRATRSAASLWLALLVSGLNACTEHKPVPRPDVKINPNPIDKYEITIQIDDKIIAPKDLVGEVSYRVHNPEKCMPVDYTRALGGVWPDPYREQPLTYDRISDYVFRTHVYEDQILNEDYYSLVVCDWGIEVASARIGVGSSIQSTGVTGQEIKSGTSRITFCPNNSRKDLMLGKGCKSIERFEDLDSEARKHFYRVEIISRRVMP